MFSGLFISHALDLEICVIMGKCNTLEIPLDDAVVGQELHNGQDGTKDKTKRISLSLPSPGEERSNIPKYCYGNSFREVAAPTEALKELAPRHQARQARKDFVRDSNHSKNLTYRKITKHFRREDKRGALRGGGWGKWDARCWDDRGPGAPISRSTRSLHSH